MIRRIHLLAALVYPLLQGSAALAADDGDVHHILPPFDARLDAVRAPAGFGTGRIWHVGPNQEYKKPSDVVSLVHDGDIVEIDAARYDCDTGVKWAAGDLTLVGVGGRPELDASHCDVAGDKGIWNPIGRGLIVDNIEFEGAHGPSGNDAAIRYDGTGYVLITRSYIHDNQEGILATPSDGAGTDFVIDRSDFGRNGGGDGSTHNIYISSSGPHPMNSFVLRFSYSHDAHVGHEVKSRALTNYILYNRLADEAGGDSSYDIDVPQGGLTYIIGNIIQHGANAQNHALVSYSSEPQHNPVQEVYIAGNTFVSEIPDAGVAVNLYDNRLAAARMVDNLVVGVAPAEPGRRHAGEDDARQQFGHLGARFLRRGAPELSPHGAVACGRSRRRSRNGARRGARRRLRVQISCGRRAAAGSGALDAGAYQYEAGEAMPEPPVINFASDSPVDYDHKVTLTWSTSNALYCGASGDWSGSVPPEGRYTSPPLSSRKTYGLACTGAGGSASQSLEIAVNQSPEAAKLGHYEWHDIPGSALEAVCASNIKKADGKRVYEDDIGTGPYCESKGNGATGVYVPTTRTWYLLGGNGGRNYYGNEVYGFDVAKLKPELVTVPDHINATKEYTPSDYYGSQVHLPGCDAILHLVAGGVVRAPSAISGTVSWDPHIGKIVVGPGAYVRGSLGCDKPETGQMSTDLWSFTPPTGVQGPVASSAAWQLLAPDDNAFGSVTTPTWIFDPASGLGYTAGNRAYPDRGGFLIDFNDTPPKSRLVNAVWPYGREADGPSVVDTDRHYALVLGNGTVALWDLNGLSMTKYGPKAPFNHESGWTVTGNTDLLHAPHHPGLTYNPKLKAFVAWMGASTVYFLYPDYRAKTLNIIAKTDIGDAPDRTDGDLDGQFVYLPDLDAYLVFTGVERDFQFLVPPTSTVAK